MNSLIDCLSCGRFSSSSGRDEGYFIVSNLYPHSYSKGVDVMFVQ